MQERWQEQRRRRKTPVQPSQKQRRKAKPKRGAGERYSPSSYAHAVRAACLKANVPPWHPHQLRHSADLQQAIEQLTAQHFAMHRSRQASWVYPTDCHRLDLACKVLDRRGIIARQNLGVCFDFGIEQIEAEAAQQTERVKGYAFFTAPMLEHAILTGQPLLFHGTAAPNPLQVPVGETIVRELRNTGLDARWDGRPASPSGRPSGLSRHGWPDREKLQRAAPMAAVMAATTRDDSSSTVRMGSSREPASSVPSNRSSWDSYSQGSSSQADAGP